MTFSKVWDRWCLPLTVTFPLSSSGWLLRTDSASSFGYPRLTVCCQYWQTSTTDVCCMADARWVPIPCPDKGKLISPHDICLCSLLCLFICLRKFLLRWIDTTLCPACLGALTHISASVLYVMQTVYTVLTNAMQMLCTLAVWPPPPLPITFSNCSERDSIISLLVVLICICIWYRSSQSQLSLHLPIKNLIEWLVPCTGDNKTHSLLWWSL